MKAGKYDAQKMAEFVEKWTGNFVSRKVLGFCTRQCKCGRRIELVLKDYTGSRQHMCIGCKMSRLVAGKILDAFIKEAGANRQEILENLKNPMWRKGLSSVLEGITKYGLKKPFVAYSPFLVVWNVTRVCNLNCKHCYENAHAPAPGELTSKQAMQAVDRMAEAGVAYVAMSGGEPLMRPDFFEIAERIKEKELAFSTATNGTLLTKEIVKKLKGVDCLYIQISLDGATAKTHNSFRGRNSFERTVNGIKNAVESGITTSIAMTVTKHNLKEVPKMIVLAERLGVSIFMHYNFIPTGRGKNILDLDISPKEREDLLEYLASQAGKGRITFLSTAPQYARVCSASNCMAASMTHFDTFSQSDNGSTKFLADFIGGCGTARLYCALEPNGDIEPCVFIPIRCGNIMKDNLLDVWQNNEIMKKLRDRKKFRGNCGICNYRNVCGGCRARAYGYFGDVQQSDPGCIFNEKEQ